MDDSSSSWDILHERGRLALLLCIIHPPRDYNTAFVPCNISNEKQQYLHTGNTPSAICAIIYFIVPSFSLASAFAFCSGALSFYCVSGQIDCLSISARPDACLDLQTEQVELPEMILYIWFSSGLLLRWCAQI